MLGQHSRASNPQGPGLPLHPSQKPWVISLDTSVGGHHSKRTCLALMVLSQSRPDSCLYPASPVATPLVNFSSPSPYTI